jgi:hypothetical protein
MRSWTRVAAALMAVGAVLFVGSPVRAADGVWTRTPTPIEPGDNFLYGADATDATHVWAVGAVTPRFGTGTGHSQILRYDGTAWRPATMSGFPSGSNGLHAVDAVTATEAWAVGGARAGISGSSTLVARWNGTTWTPEATPNGNPTGVNGLAGVAAAGGTVWAVGTYLDGSYTSHGLVLQRTGGTWRVAGAPQVLASEYLTAVDATGPADAWVVGSGRNDVGSPSSAPIALRWNGSTWSSLPPPNPGYAELYAVEAIAPNNVWVAGRAQTEINGVQPYIAQFNGTSWRRVAVPTILGGGQISDLVALSATNIVAVGTGGTAGSSIVLHWNGSTWTRETAPDAVYLNGAAAVGPDTVWAVGIGFEINAYQYRNFAILRR